MNVVNDNTLDYIFEVSEKDFSIKVIENSSDKLILLDLWAPWCEPCKQLSPILENIINDCEGRVHLAKINIDENQQIAAQLRIQSIPTVLAFKNKKIVDAFQGVLSPQDIIKFIEKNLGEDIEKNNTQFYDKINNLIENKNLNKAKSLLEDFLSQNSKDITGISLYLNCLTNLLKFQEAKDYISKLNKEILNTSELKSAITNLEIKESNSKSPSLEKIKDNYKKDPTNLKNVLKLSEKYFVNNMVEDAFELLIKQYKNNQEKNKEKIKKRLLKFFDALGNDHEQTKLFRKKFSSILFS